MSDNKPALSQTFEEKMREHVKEGFGKHITDEDIKKLIEKGVEDALFKDRPRAGQYRTEYDPPLMDLWVNKHLQVEMNRCIQEWIKENEELLLEQVKKVIQQGAGEAFVKAFRNLVDHEFMQLATRVEERLRNI